MPNDNREDPLAKYLTWGGMVFMLISVIGIGSAI
jgi:hypothetical protein